MAPRCAAKMRLLDLDDGCLGEVVKVLGLERRTLMLVCKRLRGLAERAVHERQRPGESVMDAVERAAPGSTVHLLPGNYKEVGWLQAEWGRHSAGGLCTPVSNAGAQLGHLSTCLHLPRPPAPPTLARPCC